LSDVIVVGAGIVGLAHALAAVRAGARVTVVDRDARANGASIRNFGFITVTGQEQGRVWRLARRSAAIWRNVAPAAGIRIDQEGLLLWGSALNHRRSSIPSWPLKWEKGAGA
jgi:glycine/D-amino acid oxidase-like deaminating enzyme